MSLNQGLALLDTGLIATSIVAMQWRSSWPPRILNCYCINDGAEVFCGRNFTELFRSTIVPMSGT